MPTLSERLKALGVTLGPVHTSPQTPRRPHQTIETLLPGEWRSLPLGETFVLERRYPASFRQGDVPLRGEIPPAILAAWAKEPRLTSLTLEQFLFFDIETSGLNIGGGVYAFLIGAGRFEGDEFHLAQFFLHDPADEPAQLAAFEAFAAPCEALVTFNGKAFDLPLLNGRYTLNAWPSPLKEMAHLDLLHLARRLWRARLPSRALGDLETHILGTQRGQADVPGWMVADLYLEYLHTGDAHPLIGVFYHNEMDVLSMAALLHHTAALLADPLASPETDQLDLLAIARLHADLGDLDPAERIYAHILQRADLQPEVHLQALSGLASLHKKRGQLDAALPLWEQAAETGQVYAHVELAKVYEHRQKDFRAALRWTQAAIDIVSGKETPLGERLRWLPELEHRQARLERKLTAKD